MASITIASMSERLFIHCFETGGGRTTTSRLLTKVEAVVLIDQIGTAAAPR
jgi:hypothetical protein